MVHGIEQAHELQKECSTVCSLLPMIRLWSPHQIDRQNSHSTVCCSVDWVNDLVVLFADEMSFMCYYFLYCVHYCYSRSAVVLPLPDRQFVFAITTDSSIVSTNCDGSSY